LRMFFATQVYLRTCVKKFFYLRATLLSISKIN